MDSTRAYKFRLYPDSKRQSEIDERLILSQKLYNSILEKAKKSYEKDRKSKVNKSIFNGYMKEAVMENKDFLKIYSQSRQDIFIRVQKAYQNFFGRCKTNKGRKGFPRFKSKDRYDSFTYPQDNGSFSIEKNRLRVSRIGTMKIELHRKIEGKTKTLTIKKEAGNYYAIFTAVKDIIPPTIKDTNPVGIDVGLETFAAFSDGTKIRKPQFARKKEKKLARWQRMVARRTKWDGRKKAKLQSNNRGKAVEGLERTWQEINNQQNDYLHKITDKLTNSGYTSFAVEKLQIQNMVKNHRFARSINSASWSRFIQLLSYKAESAGMKVYEVNPKDTSKTCSNCGNIQEMPLSERIFLCVKCGMQKDRDYNASINILNRAREGHSRRNASGDAASTIQQVSQVVSLNQEHTLQRQEWNPLVAGEAHML